MIDEHKTEIAKTGREAKDKFDKMYETKRDEVDFLEATISQLEKNFHEKQKKSQVFSLLIASFDHEKSFLAF